MTQPNPILGSNIPWLTLGDWADAIPAPPGDSGNPLLPRSVVLDTNPDGAVKINSAGIAIGDGLVFDGTELIPGETLRDAAFVSIVNNYGAVGGDAAADTAAFTAALADLESRAIGCLWVEPLQYLIDAPLAATDIVGGAIRGLGVQGSTSNIAKPALMWQGAAGSGTMLELHSPQGLLVEGINFIALDSTYDGTLLTIDGNGGNGDAQYNTFRRCGLRSFSASTPNALSLDKVLNSQFDFIALGFAHQFVIGPDYVVNVTFKDGASNAASITPFLITSGDLENFNIDRWSFEPLASGAAGAVLCAGGSLIYTLNIDRCWTGDVSVDGGTWFTLGATGNGGTINIRGCFLSTPLAGDFVQLNTTNLNFTHNSVTGGAAFNGAGKAIFDAASNGNAIRSVGNAFNVVDRFLRGAGSTIVNRLMDGAITAESGAGIFQPTILSSNGPLPAAITPAAGFTTGGAESQVDGRLHLAGLLTTTAGFTGATTVGQLAAGQFPSIARSLQCAIVNPAAGFTTIPGWMGISAAGGITVTPNSAVPAGGEIMLDGLDVGV